MLDKNQAEHIFEKIKKFSSVDEIEVIFSSTDFFSLHASLTIPFTRMWRR